MKRRNRLRWWLCQGPNENGNACGRYIQSHDRPTECPKCKAHNIVPMQGIGYPPDTKYQTRDGRQYVVTTDGSIRRA
jgi:ABC-type ATPase with predicted acetyltransferase domain